MVAAPSLRPRYCQAWAPDRKQFGPDDWRVTAAGFVAAQRDNFKELETVTEQLMNTFEDSRWEFHHQKKARRRAWLYGTVLFCSTIVLDALAAIT